MEKKVRLKEKEGNKFNKRSQTRKEQKKADEHTGQVIRNYNNRWKMKKKDDRRRTKEEEG